MPKKTIPLVLNQPIDTSSLKKSIDKKPVQVPLYIRIK